MELYASTDLAKYTFQSHQNLKNASEKLEIKPAKIEEKGRSKRWMFHKKDAIQVLEYYANNPNVKNGTKTAIQDKLKEMNGEKAKEKRVESELSGKLTELNNVLNIIQLELQEKDNRIDQLNSELKENQLELKEKLSQLNSKLTQFNSINSKLTLFESQFKANSKELNKVKDEFNRVDKQLKSVNTEFNRVDSQFNSIKDEFNRVDSEFNGLQSLLNRVDTELITNFRELTWGNNPFNWVVNFIKLVASPVIHLIHRREFMFLVVLGLVILQGRHIAYLFQKSLAGEANTELPALVLMFGILFEVMPIIMTINRGNKKWIYAFAIIAVWTNICFFCQLGDFWNKLTVSIALPFAILSFSELFFDKDKEKEE